jgi:HPr kinase/phosphorylase
MLLHGTSVALREGRSWLAVVLRGASGSGKSDLALRLIEGGARLIADDQTRLLKQGGRLVATAPAALRAMIEVRGVGIVKLARAEIAAAAPLALLIDLVEPDRIERLPEPEGETLLGIVVPRLALAPFEASAAAKLRRALALATTAPSGRPA